MSRARFGPVSSTELAQLMDTVLYKLTALHAQQEKIMATLDEVTAQITAADTLVTGTLIPAIQALQAQVASLGATPVSTPALDAALAKLTTDLGAADTDAAPVTAAPPPAPAPPAAS